jgi:gluconokinase/xylulokinase
VVAELDGAGAPRERWAAVGLSAMIPTLVLADEVGTPVAPAITWEDARAEPEGEALRARLDGDRLYALTGQWVDGRYLLPMFLRLARAAPQAARRARLLLGAKDWLFLRLTGVAATDPSTASGFGCYGLEAGEWLAEVVAAAGDELRPIAAAATGPELRETAHAAAPIPAPPGDGSAPPGEPPLALPTLPAVLPSTATRPLAAAVATRLGLPEGLPVCVGGADSVLGCLGLGVERPGGVACIAGTSTVLLGVADRLVIDPGHRYLITPLAGIDGWGFEMDLLTTGSAFHWLAGLLGEAGGDEAALLAMAARVAPGAAGLAFLPYLAPGEQGALWDPLLSGSLLGLSLGHGAAEVARALVDGIVLETRRCLEVLEQAGLPRGPVCVAGGSAVDPDFRRHLSDACRRDVVYAASGESEYSAIGAAVLAAAAVGRGRPAAAPATVEALMPDESRARVWDGLWERHEAALRAVRAAGVGQPPR